VEMGDIDKTHPISRLPPFGVSKIPPGPWSGAHFGESASKFLPLFGLEACFYCPHKFLGSNKRGMKG